MSGILRLENLNKGTTLKQGDKTVLSYRLSDADGDNLNIGGNTAVARLMHPDFTRIGYESEALTVSEDNIVQFSIDSIIPSRLYYLEITVDGQYIFPSRSNEGKLSIDRSSMGAEITIIENAGIDAVVRKAVDLINEDPSLIIDEDKLISEIIANTSVGSIEEYYQEYRDAIKEYADLKPKALSAVSKSDEALTKSQNALNVANGIDAKATNALSLSESADTLSKSVQEQFNQVIIDGDSSVEAAQARVDASGQTNPTLKARLDKEHNEVTAQLAQTTNQLGSIENANARDILQIKNYLGNFENIHPKVLHFPNGWNGFKYWMAYTPYPHGDTTAENPCIAVSNDMFSWETPVGLTNPLEFPPENGYNSDTHLVYREDTDTLEIWWRGVIGGNTYSILRRTSKDGVNWNAKETVVPYRPMSPDLLSPAVIFEDGKYKMWSCFGGEVRYQESVGDNVTNWTSGVKLNIDWGNLSAWHLDVIKTDLGYEMVVCAFKPGEGNNSADLYHLVQKFDGTFTKPTAILNRSKNISAIDFKSIYRSSLLKVDGVYYLMYSSIASTNKRSMSLSFGTDIQGLNGYEDNFKREPNSRITRVSGGEVLTDFDISETDVIIINGTTSVTINSFVGGYQGKRIYVFVEGSLASANLIYNSQRLVLPNLQNATLNNTQQGMYMVCLSAAGNQFKAVLNPAPSKTPEPNKVLQLNANAQFPKSVDVSKKSIEVKSLTSSMTHEIEIPIPSPDIVGWESIKSGLLSHFNVFVNEDTIQMYSAALVLSKARSSQSVAKLTDAKSGGIISEVEFSVANDTLTATITLTAARTLTALLHVSYI